MIKNVGQTKKCNSCKKEKELHFFYNKKSAKDGRTTFCKECINNKQNLEENKKYKKQYTKLWRQRNKNYLKEYNKNRWNVYKYNIEVFYSSYKSDAKRKNRIFSLTLDQFSNLVTQNCFYCNASAQQSEKKLNGIDRVDSLQGYILTNCIACCIVCNRMKLNYTKEFFINHVLKICNKQMEKK